MTLNLQIIKNAFLPLMFISLAIFAGGQSAKAEDPNAIDATTSISNPIARSPQHSNIALAPETSQTKAIPGTVVTRGAALLGEPSISANNQLAISEFSNSFTGSQRFERSTLRVAQTSPSTDTPGRAVPGSVPSNTPTNPADVTPSNTTPSTTTPGTLTPDTTTPTAPLNTTPAAPSTTPGTITPGTTTPGTITPDTTTPTTPGTITPDTTTPTTPGTTTPDTTTPTTPGTTETQPLAPTVDPGRATRSGSSYVGVGGNIGIGSGDTQLGQGSFAVISKIGLTREFSVRPSVLFSDSVTILLPVTYDFTFGEGPTGDLGFTAAPYLGVGAAISTGDDAEVGLLLTGGIDVPLSRQFTATASVNASVTGEAAVGILLGVGYNFTGL